MASIGPEVNPHRWSARRVRKVCASQNSSTSRLHLPQRAIPGMTRPSTGTDPLEVRGQGADIGACVYPK
jgi:hypothetical protein